ncbi:hypothetical protein TIFTF001_014064 [Ficus carica]|uniref:Uncharacterized protein n=1 Tax=Ficus carica TaxID=3494 RepID=A0AA88DID7_FICCA|nr:hypothetical protein TIFTF001_014064 [Ficus carica]
MKGGSVAFGSKPQKYRLKKPREIKLWRGWELQGVRGARVAKWTFVTSGVVSRTFATSKAVRCSLVWAGSDGATIHGSEAVKGMFARSVVHGIHGSGVTRRSWQFEWSGAAIRDYSGRLFCD